MATEIKIPKLNFSMAEGTVTKWLVEDGATVAAGTPIYELEAEKSVQEVEAPVAGKVRVIARTGEAYPVGTVIAEID
ncbi:MAG: biotin/lipoyl-containing protein [Gammaproteobacteria bacterium]